MKKISTSGLKYLNLQINLAIIGKGFSFIIVHSRTVESKEFLNDNDNEREAIAKENKGS